MLMITVSSTEATSPGTDSLAVAGLRRCRSDDAYMTSGMFAQEVCSSIKKLNGKKGFFVFLNFRGGFFFLFFFHCLFFSLYDFFFFFFFCFKISISHFSIHLDSVILLYFA